MIPTHTLVIDLGHFSKGVPIEHRHFDDFAGAYGDGAVACAVAAITYADGRRRSLPTIANR